MYCSDVRATERRTFNIELKRNGFGAFAGMTGESGNDRGFAANMRNA